MAKIGKKKKARNGDAAAQRDEKTNLVISYPNLRFSRDRIELLRDENPVQTIDRETVTGVLIRRGSPSEHPLRETAWGLGLTIAAALTITEAVNSGKTVSWIVSSFLVFAVVMIAKHLLSSVTIIELKGDWISGQLNVGQAVEEREIARLNQRLAEDLDWPVKR
jgi:hypothetical protein